MATSLLAAHLCNQQPHQIQNRLRQDEVFTTRFGLVSPRVLTLGGDVHIEQRKLFAATRQALQDKQATNLEDIHGGEIIVTFEQGHLFLESPSKRRKTQVDALLILSPLQDERVQTLRYLLEHLGPTVPDFSPLLTQAVERDLSDEEVSELFTENTKGVVALQARAIAAFNSNQVALEDLIPNSFAYFERFCGPNPEGADPEDYLGTILPLYRKNLMRRDLVRGLNICLQGALRDDLMPGTWTENFNDDEIWEALTACGPWGDPFALLGALDIALTRQHDERYQGFAEQAVQKLVQEEFLRPDGIDTYELLPLWAELVLNCINMLEGGALRPPYWKRLCAWMQAGFLSHLTQRCRFDLASLREWIQGNQIMVGTYAKMADLRHEPMYRAAETSSRALRGEIVGRLVYIRERYQAAGRIIPGADSIDKAMSRLAEQGSPLDWALPGPLYGHRRSSLIVANTLSETYVEERSRNPSTPVVSTLAYLSQVFDLGAEHLERMREVIGRVEVGEETNLVEQMVRFTDAGLVACAQRDGELASIIATAVVAIAQEAHKEHEIAVILQALLVASAAFQNEDVWAPWLEKQLVEIALRLPAGQPSQLFYKHIGELKKVLPWHLGIHSRAEAIASAAMYR